MMPKYLQIAVFLASLIFQNRFPGADSNMKVKETRNKYMLPTFSKLGAL